MAKKVSIEFNKAVYLIKCNSKRCYMCNSTVAKYIELMCVCGDTVNCPLCSTGKPANIPICNNKVCLEKLQDSLVNI